MSAKSGIGCAYSTRRCYYSIEFSKDLFRNKEMFRQQAALKHLREAQKALGQLNDDATGQSLAAAQQRDGVRASLRFPSRKREKRLIERAAAAYRKLAALKPLRA